ncbi:MAG: SCO family protein [Candidatus Omnitrophica bacterium]|nr:SCO family protein [Candidatus Omnitrophota bacterium]
MAIKIKNNFNKLWFLILLLALFGIANAASHFFIQSFLSSGESLPFYGQVPPFNLKDQMGGNFGNADLAGKVWIADLIFTRCAGPCPLMSFRMAKLQKSFAENSDIKFVSFSVDPERDTPKVLLEYAERFNADKNQWHFLTGDRAVIHQLARGSFHMGVAAIPAQDKEAALSLSHSTKFVLVDRAGRIRGFYDGEGESPLDNLIRDAKILMKMKTNPK